MSAISRLLAGMYKLPPAMTHDICTEKNLEIPMSDGIILRADRYYPKHEKNVPTLLVRTPYGRSRQGVVWGNLFPERGFQVVIQSCRGTDDSDGVFIPFRGEREDGLATLEWLKQQNWFDGRLGMAGPSYMGFTQWAVAPEAGPELMALSTHVTSSEFRSPLFPGGSFNLEIFLQWLQITHSLKSSFKTSVSEMFMAGKRLKSAVWHLPLTEADSIAVGENVPAWQQWMEHSEEGDTWWDREDFSKKVSQVEAPNHLISGWYDFMLPQLLRDYTALKNANRSPYLTIGPWSHSSNDLFQMGIQETLKWFRIHLLGEKELLRSSPVRIYIMGSGEWRDLKQWPPEGIETKRLYLHSEKSLSQELPPEAEPDRFLYDPADPTPNIGGATNSTLGKESGSMDNYKLEQRDDVLIYSSKPLQEKLTIMGPVIAEIFLKSIPAHADIFVRLCDVSPSGKSMNVCDGIIRLIHCKIPADTRGCVKATVSLAHTAHCFKQTHILRLQVSGGAFPRFPRNTGTGEPLATGTETVATEHFVYHGAEHPSCVMLPIYPD